MKKHSTKNSQRSRRSPLFVLLSWVAATLICIACGGWLYYWSKTGYLLETGIQATMIQTLPILLPFLLSIFITKLFNAKIEGEENTFPLWVIALILIVICRVLGSVKIIIPFTTEIFHISKKALALLQHAAPLAAIYSLSTFFILNKPATGHFRKTMEKPGFRFLSALVATLICTGCGFWAYLWAQDGRLLDEANQSFWRNQTIFILPFLMSIAASRIYYAEIYGETSVFPAWVIALIAIVLFPFLCETSVIKSLLARYNDNTVKTLKILQFTIPLGVIYFFCMPFIIFTKLERPVNHAEVERILREMQSQSTTVSDTNKDADSKGLASGKGY